MAPLSRPSPWPPHHDEDGDGNDENEKSDCDGNDNGDYSLSSSAATGDCELGPSWLLWLCVVFGVLFLVRIIYNLTVKNL